MKITPLVALLILVFFGVACIFHLLDFISITNAVVIAPVLYHDYIFGLLLVGVGQGMTLGPQATLEMSNREIHLNFLISY